jgi:hypothetical protein
MIPNTHHGSEPFPRIRSIEEVALLCTIKLRLAMSRINRTHSTMKPYQDQLYRHLVAADALITLSDH